MDMRIVNDEGQELPWDGKAAGELQVRGPHVLKAYFRVCHTCSQCPGLYRVLIWVIKGGFLNVAVLRAVLCTSCPGLAVCAA